MGNREAWEAYGGAVYSMADIKIPHVMPLMRSLDYGVDNPVVIDVGSGYPSVTEQNRMSGRRFITANVDIAIGDRDEPRVKDFAVDIDDLTHGKMPDVHDSLRDFLAERSEAGRPEADAVVYSEILNYVDYQGTLEWFDGLLKVGGFAIAANQPGRGIKEYFSDKGIKNNTELIDFCTGQLGYEVRHLRHPVAVSYTDLGFMVAAFQKMAR